MNSIDFLPNRFREQSARRKTNAWRLIVLLLFGVVIGAAALGQAMFRGGLYQEIAEADLRYAAAQATNAQHALMQDRQAASAAKANLAAYLQFQWPRTKLLQAIYEAQTTAITLSEVHLARETAELSRPGPRKRGSAEKETAAVGPSAADRDLAQLLAETENSNVAMLVAGRTNDGAELHQFVSRLNQHAMFQGAELRSLEAVADHTPGAVTWSTFQVRLIVAQPTPLPAIEAEQTAQPPTKSPWK